MQVRFETRVPTDLDVREHTTRRAAFVLRRLSSLMPRVHVQLSDVNGPRGGMDKRCQVDIRTSRGERVVVTSTARDWHDAVNEALARAAQVLTRRWQRLREHRSRAAPLSVA